MKQDPCDEKFQEGDVCRWKHHVLVEEPGIGVLIRKTRSYMTGTYWEILAEDGTIKLVQESCLEKVVNQ
tara:strand:- start:1771 stop:1977 length:207 start_codon:yes stop_codon:yes gene_type:complete